MIPTASSYPEAFDTDDNLFVVHDSLRLTLASDYSPGDTTITVYSDPVMAKFPPTGLITLTEQCSDLNLRAVSFYYSAHDDTTFSGLELLDGFTDAIKSKNITHVTMNVMAQHHNSIKDSVIATEGFVGIKGTTDIRPGGDTMEGRLNYLYNQVFTPRAWFTADITSGLAPLAVSFVEQCFRLGDGDVTFLWDFGDPDTMTVSPTATVMSTTMVAGGTTGVVIDDTDGGSIKKIYNQAGLYDVRLTVTNKYGSDTVNFPDYVRVFAQAPDEAIMGYTLAAGTSQIITSNSNVTPPSFSRLATTPAAGYIYPATIRASTNTFINILVSDPGVNVSDPVVAKYTWEIDDDLVHQSAPNTRASFSIGGIYDLRLRIDTSIGGFRITTYKNSIDVIERRNLWLFSYLPTSTVNVIGSEFGFISETFKVASQTYAVTANKTFLNGSLNSTQAQQEFAKNAVFTPLSTIDSGSNGTAILMYASGGNLMSGLGSQTIVSKEYNGFSDTYSTPIPAVNITRPWNWVFLPIGGKGYFVFGPDPSMTANTNNSYQQKTTLDFTAGLAVSNVTLNGSNYLDGASELTQNITTGYTAGEPNNGRFAVYRSAVKDGNTGYLLRNGGAGNFFRLNSFYKTEGVLADPFINIRKLTDMSGPLKAEGQLVALSDGIFFFNNTGSISVYDDTAEVWKSGGPAVSSVSFASLQDSSITGFDNPANRLLATGDGDHAAYLSFDYSNNAMAKFNSSDMTFQNINGRPASTGAQWTIGSY